MIWKNSFCLSAVLEICLSCIWSGLSHGLAPQRHFIRFNQLPGAAACPVCSGEWSGPGSWAGTSSLGVPSGGDAALPQSSLCRVQDLSVRFTVLHVDIQWPQHCVLKGLPFPQGGAFAPWLWTLFMWCISGVPNLLTDLSGCSLTGSALPPRPWLRSAPLPHL